MQYKYNIVIVVLFRRPPWSRWPTALLHAEYISTIHERAANVPRFISTSPVKCNPFGTRMLAGRPQPAESISPSGDWAEIEVGDVWVTGMKIKSWFMQRGIWCGAPTQLHCTGRQNHNTTLSTLMSTWMLTNRTLRVKLAAASGVCLLWMTLLLCKECIAFSGYLVHLGPTTLYSRPLQLGH